MTLLQADGTPAPSTAPLTVALCVPCQDQVAAGWAFDFARLVGFTAANFPEIQLVTLQVRSTLLPDQRNSLVRRALDHDATHLLWFDADMRFPKDALIRLLNHDVDIVGTNYASRRPPNIPTAERAGEGLVYITPGAEGLLEVTRMGFGLVLTKAAVFYDLEKPYFSLAYRPQHDDFTGEDVFFCRKAKEAGFIPYIDLKLSQEVGHIGEFTYGLEHSDALRQVAQAEGRKTLTAGGPNGPLDAK
jgi:hypothetical protein